MTNNNVLSLRIGHGMLVLLMTASLSGEAFAQSRREPPLLLDFQQGVQAELAGLAFVDEVVDGGRRMRVPVDGKDKHRLGIATVKISKPAGTRITLACADITLHYYHGDETEVTPCEGLSSFVSSQDSDREINLSNTNGPGFLKKQTSVRTTEATIVYIDVLFGYMEPDTREAWISLGQVYDRNRSFISSGWKP